MQPRKGRVIALSAGTVLLLVLGAAVFFLREDLADYLHGWRRGAASRPLREVGELTGQKVDIAAGEIQMPQFLRFLSDYTGLPVIFDSKDKRISEGKILVAAPVRDADAELVKAILETNGYRVLVETLPGGKEVLRIEVSDGTR
jgi:hypothetical protein